MGGFAEVVFLNEFLRDIRELDAHIFGLLHWGLEIEVFQIKRNKVRIATRQNAFNDNFDKVELSGWCTYIPRVANLTTCDGDARAIRVFLVGFDLEYYHGMANFMMSVLWNVDELDESEGVCAFHALLPWYF